MKSSNYPKVTKFEDLVVWKKSIELSRKIYKELRNVKDYGLKDQMQRASVSVFSNIAEGYERKSNKEYVRFLYIAKGSCSELRAQLYLAREIELLSKSIISALIKDTKDVSAMLHNYILTRINNF